MSQIPNTPSEIIKKYGDELFSDWGANVLQQPEQNRGDPLVRLMSMAAISLSDIQSGIEANSLRRDPNNLEGIELTTYAASRGVFRKTNTSSMAILIVTGLQGAILPAESQLTDRFGSVWRTTEDIQLNSDGVGCAFAQGIVCASDPGSFVLQPGELSFDNAGMEFIFSATNGDMVTVGGAEESNESLRRRLSATGPLSRITGTSDNAIAKILEVDGVEYANFAIVDSCIGSGPMFIVSGGEPERICDTIERFSGVCGNLVGEVSCGDCTSVRFQRPCPLLLEMEVFVDDSCLISDEEQIKSLIMSIAPQVARQSKVRSGDISNLQQIIDSVVFRAKRMPLTGCFDGSELIVTDPFSMEELIFATDNPTGLCGGLPDCEDGDFSNSISINPWEYFLMDATAITITSSPQQQESDCAACE